MLICGFRGKYSKNIKAGEKKKIYLPQWLVDQNVSFSPWWWFNKQNDCLHSAWLSEMAAMVTDSLLTYHWLSRVNCHSGSSLWGKRRVPRSASFRETTLMEKYWEQFQLPGLKIRVAKKGGVHNLIQVCTCDKKANLLHHWDMCQITDCTDQPFCLSPNSVILSIISFSVGVALAELRVGLFSELQTGTKPITH